MEIGCPERSQISSWQIWRRGGIEDLNIFCSQPSMTHFSGPSGHPEFLRYPIGFSYFG